jgi:hypothetical protein
VILLACSRDKPAPTRTEPWPAASSSAAAVVRGLPARFEVEPVANASFVLKGKAAAPAGKLRVARGQLDLDLLDLSRTRGVLAFDLASVLMEGEKNEQVQENTRRAQNWLDLGSNRPEAERERLRWAEFSIKSVEKPSAEAAHEGKVARRGSLPSLADDAAVPEAADGGDGGEPDTGEVRVVTLTAKGPLTLHGHRIDQSIDVRILFYYAMPATPGARPTRLAIQSRRPLVLALQAFDIKPRDESGVFIARDMKLLSQEVGQNAVSVFEVWARPAP